MDKTTHPTLRNLLLTHIQNTAGWISKGSMYILAENEGYSPETAGRELRLLAEENKIKVDYYKSKRNVDLARYARHGEVKPIPPKSLFHYEERDGQRVAVYN